MVEGTAAHRRRRRLELFLAIAMVFGVSAVLLGEGHHPLRLSGGLLSSSGH